MTPPLAQHLAPDTIAKLERAARARYDDAEALEAKRPLPALYLYGYTVEMCLAAAYFRALGFGAIVEIDGDTRRRHMARARQLGLMSAAAHPLDGWALLLRWHRTKLGVRDEADAQCLAEAVNRAKTAYLHWRPELRYNTTKVAPTQIKQVREAAAWFLKSYPKL